MILGYLVGAHLSWSRGSNSHQHHAPSAYKALRRSQQNLILQPSSEAPPVREWCTAVVGWEDGHSSSLVNVIWFETLLKKIMWPDQRPSKVHQGTRWDEEWQPCTLVSQKKQHDANLWLLNDPPLSFQDVSKLLRQPFVQELLKLLLEFQEPFHVLQHRNLQLHVATYKEWFWNMILKYGSKRFDIKQLEAWNALYFPPLGTLAWHPLRPTREIGNEELKTACTGNPPCRGRSARSGKNM